MPSKFPFILCDIVSKLLWSIISQLKMSSSEPGAVMSQGLDWVFQWGDFQA